MSIFLFDGADVKIPPVVVFLLSFLMDTTWPFRAVALLYSVSFVAMVLMFLLHGEVIADTRSVFPLRRPVTTLGDV